MTARSALHNEYTSETEDMRPNLMAPEPSVEIGLNAAIIAMHDYEPVFLSIKPPSEAQDQLASLPSGPFSPVRHRTLEIGLRSWVAEQTGLELGYSEQLYTFGDRGRHAQAGDTSPHVVSIGYLAISDSKTESDLHESSSANWEQWYRFFPWEDWRKGPPEILEKEILPRLKTWVNTGTIGAISPPPKLAGGAAAADGTSETDPQRTTGARARENRMRSCFGLDAAGWDEERVLERYELLYEAGLVEEAARDGRTAAMRWSELPRLGAPMRYDHRRILAMAIGRLRAKLKYRPVVFELMAQEFTLFELQKTVEAILGPPLHKQNFRRLVENSKLVEPTGGMKTRTGGRPAKLFRFRREVITERPAPGVRLKPGHH